MWELTLMEPAFLTVLVESRILFSPGNSRRRKESKIVFALLLPPE
jgi:hypothetical protein